VVVITYELIPALDLWHQVAGVSRWATLHNDLYRAVIAEHPEWNIPIAGTSGADVNPESVLRFNPDVVITWSYNPDVVAFLEKKGLTVIALYPKSLKELYDLIRLHGVLFGKDSRARYVIEEMESVLRMVKERVRGIPTESRRRTLFLAGKPTTVFTSDSLFTNMLQLAGAVSVSQSVESTDVSTADVSMETIVRWNPEVIFIWGSAGYSVEWLLENSQWRHIQAVKQRMVYKLPSWSGWSPRFSLVVLWMAKKLYPEHFQDIDFETFADSFYRKIFGISYSKVAAYSVR
jgi:iron complex transport system substrate-binding protein